MVGPDGPAVVLYSGDGGAGATRCAEARSSPKCHRLCGGTSCSTPRSRWATANLPFTIGSRRSAWANQLSTPRLR